MKRIAGIGIILAVFMIGCATQGQRARTEATVGGAAIGGAVGAVAGQVIGRNTESTAIGGAIGAAIGGVAGNLFGKKVVDDKRALDQREQNLTARLQHARNINAQTTAYNQNLSRKIVNLSREIDYAIAKINRRQMTKTELVQLRQKLNNEVNLAKNQLKSYENRLAELRRVSPKGQSREMDQEIARLDTLVKKLRQNTYQLASINQRI